MNEQPSLPFPSPITYTWPCLTCGVPTPVAFNTFNALKDGALNGVYCNTHVTPPFTPPPAHAAAKQVA